MNFLRDFAENREHGPASWFCRGKDPELTESRSEPGTEARWPESPDQCRLRVHRLCMRMLSGPDEAEDVTQKVMLQLHQNLDRFEGRSSWKTWVFRTALNAVRNFRRSRKYSRALFAPNDEGLERVPDDVPTPAEAASKEELRRRVREALERIPDEYREALVLRDRHDLTYQEIADVLEIPIGTVKSRLHNGLVILGRLLDEL